MTKIQIDLQEDIKKPEKLSQVLKTHYFYHCIEYILKLNQILQAVAILPIYLLQLCYGMQSGFPAVLTPQLNSNCSNHSAEYSVNENEESWIGKLSSSILS